MSAGRRGERGQAGGAESLVFGMLIFVVGALLIASVWAVIDTKLAVVSAAREAARTFVESDGLEDARADGAAAAEQAMQNHGRAGEVEVTFDAASGFARCARITARVSYRVPAVPLPWVGGIGEITVAARHSELVDPYRDGVAGSARCPT